MPAWEEVDKYQAKSLRVGQKVRAYKGSFNQAEGIVKRDEEGDLYATYIGYLTNQYGEEGLGDWHDKWDRLEVHHVVPTEPGFYVSVRAGKANKILARNNDYWLIDSVAYHESDEIVQNLLPFRKFVEDKTWEPPVDEPEVEPL